MRSLKIVDPDARRILRNFCTWSVLRNLRRASDRRPLIEGQYQTARQSVRVAILFTGWIQNRGQQLATCTQSDIDDWLADGPTTNLHARNFLTWCASRGYVKDVEIPIRKPSEEITNQLDSDDERWTQIRRLLHDPGLDTVDRVAGCLLLLYGQPLSRICRLTIDKIASVPASSASPSAPTTPRSRIRSAPFFSILRRTVLDALQSATTTTTHGYFLGASPDSTSAHKG